MLRKKKKSPELDWMMWQVEKSQADDAPMANLIRAVQHFNEKYGRIPNRAEIPTKWPKDFASWEGMVVTRSRSVRPGHIMLALDPSLTATLPINPKAA